MLNLPNAGLPPANSTLQLPIGDDKDDTATVAITRDDDDGRRYLL